jgi:hypothetical protein
MGINDFNDLILIERKVEDRFQELHQKRLILLIPEDDFEDNV